MKKKEINCFEVSSCKNCTHWKRCFERGRGICTDYERRQPMKKKSKVKENLKMFAGCLFIVLAAYAIILI